MRACLACCGMLAAGISVFNPFYEGLKRSYALVGFWQHFDAYCATLAISFAVPFRVLEFTGVLDVAWRSLMNRHFQVQAGHFVRPTRCSPFDRLGG